MKTCHISASCFHNDGNYHCSPALLPLPSPCITLRTIVFELFQFTIKQAGILLNGINNSSNAFAADAMTTTSRDEVSSDVIGHTLLFLGKIRTRFQLLHCVGPDLNLGYVALGCVAYYHSNTTNLLIQCSQTFDVPFREKRSSGNATCCPILKASVGCLLSPDYAP